MFSIKPINKNEVANSQYVKDYNNDLYSITNNNGDTIAYVTFRIDNNIMWLDMIEVVNKEKGLGREIVNFLSENYSVSQIKGFILCEERALYFWNKLGAEIYYIDVEGYEIEELVDAGLESPFTYNG